MLAFALFFHGFIVHLDRYILLNKTEDWPRQLSRYENIRHQVFALGQFPHYYPYQFKGQNVLFANPENSVLTPVNLLLPFVSIFTFFRLHFCLHYLVALVGIMLLVRLFRLPAFAGFLIFVLFGFNGRITSNYYVGHTAFITYTWLPLLFYFYFGYFIEKFRHTLYRSIACAIVLAMIFFEGGIHLIDWILLFMMCDAVLVLAGMLARRDGRRPADFLRPLCFWASTLALYLGLVAIKFLPSAYIWAGMDIIGGGYAHMDIPFFLQTFYQAGLGTTIPFREGWLQEVYNYIGSVASVLAVLSILHAVLLGKDRLVRRMALITVMFLVFCTGNIVTVLFQHIPFLHVLRSTPRFVFIALALVSLLIPIALNDVLTRLKSANLLKETAMFAVGCIAFLQMWSENRKWMVVKGEPVQLQPDLLSTYALPGGYAFWFHLGCLISAVTVIALSATLAYYLVLQRRNGRSSSQVHSV